MKNIRKIFTLIMVLAMVLSLAVPAMAAEDEYALTISHPRQLTDHTYEAYQIFAGILTTNNAGQEILSSITWGSGINAEKKVNDKDIIAALKAADNLFASADTAAKVADILSKNSTNVELVNKARHIFGTYLSDTCTVLVQTSNGVYTATVPAGYYLIKDQDGSLDEKVHGETYTNYILQVVGDTNVNPKGGSVTHDKLIEDGGNRVEAADYSIGDDVKFVLRGTLPANYSDFETYSYKFVDTLSPGLTLDENSIVVYLENAGTKTELPTGFVVTKEGQSFTVYFENLKAITDRTIDQHTTIIVEYTAKLNDQAIIGGNGNPNTSYIIFDNDPHSDGEGGKTPEDTVYAFTWELDVFKIDGENAKLEGAEFILYRDLSGEKQYAIVNADGVLIGWTTNRENATTLVSDVDGKFIIKGLEADIYHLEETKEPEGYNKLQAPITVDITATVQENADGTKGEVVNLQIKVDNHNYVDGDKDKGIVSMNVINNPGATLPETGGVGTTLFYVFGGLMVAAAIVLLVTKKRMNTEA